MSLHRKGVEVRSVIFDILIIINKDFIGYILGMSGLPSSRSKIGGRLATMLVATINNISFFFFFFLFGLHRLLFSQRSAQIKKLIQRKLTSVPKNPKPVGHFGVPQHPFGILLAVRRCRQFGVAGCERVPLALLG